MPVLDHPLTKRCGGCNQRKRLTSFPQHRLHRDGHASLCKRCSAEKSRDWYHRRQLETDRLYSTYVAMKQRCYNPRHDSYPFYGRRGIGICKEWRASFAAFADWAMRNGYRSGLQIDRVNNDRGYSPANCRFVTPQMNAQNRRTSVAPVRRAG